jgi:signal peptidase I
MTWKDGDVEPSSGLGALDAPIDEDDDGLPNRRSRSRKGARQAIEWVILIVSALVIALLIKTFLFQAFYIPSASMVPTLEIHDRVLVNKLSYKMHDIHRGDIVVFDAPPGTESQGIKDLVKRVVGLPGETVVGHDDHVYITHVGSSRSAVLPEKYLHGVTTTPFAAHHIPAGSIWVMGDNRSESRDSRSFGPIPEKSVVGRVFIRIWPLSRLDFL